MKRLGILIFSLMLLPGTTAAFSGNRVYIGGGAGYFSPSDENYKATYGSSAIIPEVEVGIRLFWHLHLIGGYSFLSKKGEVPELGIESKSRQQYLRFGAGVVMPIAKSVSFLLAGGGASISYTEEVLDIKVSGNKIGFFGEAGLNIHPISMLYIGFRAKYLQTKDVYEATEFKLGGFTLASCIGFTF